MGTGHRQQNLFKTDWQNQFSHGGILRNKRRGRGQRPLSTKEPLHVVFKINRSRLRYKTLRSPQTYSLLLGLVKKYSVRFSVRIEQLSVQGDHYHVLLRAPRRGRFHDFFRVVAGQIAQTFEREGLLVVDRTITAVTGTPRKHKQGPETVAKPGTGLWKYRPFSRVVRGYRAYKTVQNYIQMNEKEALGKIAYQKQRLRGLSSSDWEELWK